MISPEFWHTQTGVVLIVAYAAIAVVVFGGLLELVSRDKTKPGVLGLFLLIIAAAWPVFLLMLLGCFIVGALADDEDLDEEEDEEEDDDTSAKEKANLRSMILNATDDSREGYLDLSLKAMAQLPYEDLADIYRSQTGGDEPSRFF